MTKTVWHDKNIPQLEFCKLDRACEILDCKISDLLHWSDIGAIQLCLLFENFQAAIYRASWGDLYSREEVYSKIKEEVLGNSIPFHGDISSNHPLSSALINVNFNLDNGDVSPSDPGVNVDWNEKCDYFNANIPLGVISGLWLIPRGHQNWEQQLLSNRHAKIRSLGTVFLPADCDELVPEFKAYPRGQLLPISWDTYELFQFTIDDIYITKKQIEILFDHKGKDIPNFINGMRSRPKEGTEKQEAYQSRVTTRQSTMIVALLLALGITDDDMQGSTTKMETKLKNIASRRSVAIPDIDPKTWREWLSREGKR